jgi:hypothetical protein
MFVCRIAAIVALLVVADVPFSETKLNDPMPPRRMVGA